MKANDLLSKQNNCTTDFSYSGESCPRCKEGARGIECQHDFDSDPKRIWEVIYCSFCGHEFDCRDVTHVYEAKAFDFLEASEEDALHCMDEEDDHGRNE